MFRYGVFFLCSIQVILLAGYVFSQADSLPSSIQIRVIYPLRTSGQGASFVTIRTSLSDWSDSTRCAPSSDTDSEFVCSIATSQPQFELKALLDDKIWQIGANEHVDIRTSLVSTIRGNGELSLSIYPWFFTTRGSLRLTSKVFSPQLNNTRSLITYLPPSYFENILKPIENLVIAHDGQNLFDPKTAFLNNAWMCQDTLDPLIYEGKMREVVIVGVYNTPDRTFEYTYDVDSTVGDGGGGNLYLDFLEETVLPLVLIEYRISPNPRISMFGSSLGGLISCYAGWTRSYLYSSVACMSSSFWWNNQSFNNTILTHPPKRGDPLQNLSVYLDSGDSGPDQDDKEQTIAVRNHFDSLRFTLDSNLFYYLDKGGQHNEKYWGARFSKPCVDLWSPETKVPNNK